ncbi:hypothetical protein CCR75_003195 [Bremia lactucae]|uniref:Elicitin n=1 Tax=Bremia lactucae TaxID=4779 RepID=A0A976FMS1_BRELC|nr:hypothetical protein CCR75_003195 [Bremia lactucae]
MTKYTLATSTLLIAFAVIVSAHDGEDHSQATDDDVSTECESNVSTSFIDTIDNSSYFNTCAEGTTFNVTSVFDALNFTEPKFLTFCNSSTCLEPIHRLMGSVDCLITYMGEPRDLSDEISKLHDECHEVLDAANLTMNMDGESTAGGATNNTGSITPEDETASNSPTLIITLGSVISATVIAAFLV